MTAEATPTRIRLARWLALLAQLALLLAAFRAFKLPALVGDAFWRASLLSVAGFALHFWLPLRLKEPFWIALSLGGGAWIAGPRETALLLALALLLFAIGRAPLPRAARLALFVAVGLACALARRFGLPGIDAGFWPLAGGVLFFRAIVWAYDATHAAAPPSLRDYLAYMLLLPNFGSLLFPVVDFRTMRKRFLARDPAEIAQTGATWMARGLVQLVLYVWIYDRKIAADPFAVDSAWKLALCMAQTYLLYLRLSGTFHFVIGLLHLFGYDLPETHRKWLLADSLTDFWRRINIYWKDFMVKLVWFPLYFRWRKGGERRAQLLATTCVFVVTWFLHAMQTFWATGAFLWRSTDLAFWGVLGGLVVANLALELRPGRTAAIATGARRVARIAGTALLLTLLWSMWNAKSFGEWLDLLTWWRAGAA